ncbi:multiheme c-type cytochrome [Thermoproteota archaeon]
MKSGLMKNLAFLALFSFLFILPAVYSQEEEPYLGPEYCKKCHPALYELWDGSMHSTAYLGLNEWDKTHGNIASSFCLDCHFTSVKYNISDVTCETCHGPNDNMIIDDISKFCGRCHIEIQSNLNVGAHTDKLDCINCHTPHSIEIKASTSTELCEGCHTNTFNSYLDGTHHSNEVGCIDCHMKRVKGDNYVPEFDHTFYPITDICFDCHNPHTVQSIVDLNMEYSSSLFNLQEEVVDLEYIDYAKNILVLILLTIIIILTVLLSKIRYRRQQN